MPKGIHTHTLSNSFSSQNFNLSFRSGNPPNSPTVLPIKGRLLTPAEGCGVSKVAQIRIVGGTQAKNGAWPWMALLGYSIKEYTAFNCGKKIYFNGK